MCDITRQWIDPHQSMNAFAGDTNDYKDNEPVVQGKKALASEPPRVLARAARSSAGLMRTGGGFRGGIGVRGFSLGKALCGLASTRQVG